MLSACSTGVFHCKLYPRSISSWLCSFIDGLPQPSHWEFVVHLWIWSCCVSSSVHCFFLSFSLFWVGWKGRRGGIRLKQREVVFSFHFCLCKLWNTENTSSGELWVLGHPANSARKEDLISSERTGWGSSLLLHQHRLWLQVLSGQPLPQEHFTQQPFAATAPWRC